MFKRKLLFSIILIILPTLIYAAVTDHLILQDIGPYKLFTTVFPEDFKGGQLPKYSQTATPGVLWAVGHLKSNHDNYNASYTRPGSKWPFVEVDVTVHNDPDASKWVLHELDIAYRNYYGVPGLSYSPVQIDGYTILEFAAGGRDYRWISGNNVVQIEYHDGMMALPEPLEVVKAYLHKHPSTLPAITLKTLRSDANVEAWIQTEMDRRLWLCEKRIFLSQNDPTPDKNDPHLYRLGKDLNVFLDYREKYYGKKAIEDKRIIQGYIGTSDISAIKKKLTEYQTWWEKHKKRID